MSIPLIMHVISSTTIGGSEVLQNEMEPVFRLDDIGATLLTMHVLGDAGGITAGKTLTIRFHSANNTALAFGSDPVVATVAVSANGLFHVSVSFAPTAAARLIYISFQTDSLTNVVVNDMLWIVEAA